MWFWWAQEVSASVPTSDSSALRTPTSSKSFVKCLLPTCMPQSSTPPKLLLLWPSWEFWVHLKESRGERRSSKTIFTLERSYKQMGTRSSVILALSCLSSWETKWSAVWSLGSWWIWVNNFLFRCPCERNRIPRRQDRPSPSPCESHATAHHRPLGYLCPHLRTKLREVQRHLWAGYESLHGQDGERTECQIMNVCILICIQ